MRVLETLNLMSCIEIVVPVNEYEQQQLELEALTAISLFQNNYRIMNGIFYPVVVEQKVKVNYSGIAKINSDEVRLYYTKVNIPTKYNRK
jgi:hypothetical protein